MNCKPVWILVLALLLCGCDSSNLRNSETTPIKIESGLVSFGEVTQQDLEGAWVDQAGEQQLVFSEQNVVYIEKYVDGEFTVEQVRWTLDDNGLTVTDSQGGALDYKLVEENGQIRIMGNGSQFAPLEEQESLESMEVNFLGIGETAATDQVKLTLTGIEFSTAASQEMGTYLMPNPSGSMQAESGQLLACLSFQVQNLKEDTLSREEFCNLILEYDRICRCGDGFYGTDEGPECDIPAKTRMMLRCVICCPEAVGEENDLPLSIDLVLPSSEGDVHFTYVLK